MPGIGIKPFTARIGGGNTGTLAVATSSERQTLLANGGLVIGSVAVLTRDADSVAFVEFGDSTVAATASSGADAQRSSQPIPPGRMTVLGMPAGGATHFAAICASGGSAVVMVTVGDGV